MKFELSKKEIENLESFKKEMNKKYTNDEKYCGAVGGFYTICFTPTGIGIIVTAKTLKGDEKNITDFDLW